MILEVWECKSEGMISGLELRRERMVLCNHTDMLYHVIGNICQKILVESCNFLNPSSHDIQTEYKPKVLGGALGLCFFKKWILSLPFLSLFFFLCLKLWQLECWLFDYVCGGVVCLFINLCTLCINLWLEKQSAT